MNWLSIVMVMLVVLSALLRIYMILLTIRIVLTWVSMDHGHPALRVLHALCDPYLNWFRRFRKLTLGPVDFSPMVAIAVVYVALFLTERIGREGMLSVGIVLAVLTELVWATVAFVLILVGMLALIRFLAIRFRLGNQSVWAYVDNILQPVAYGIGRVLRPRTFLAYTTTLLILGILSLLVWFLGSKLFDLIDQLLRSIPI